MTNKLISFAGHLILPAILLSVSLPVFSREFILDPGGNELESSSTSYYIKDVLDFRAEKDNIGTAMVTIFNKRAYVKLNGSLKESLSVYFGDNFKGGQDSIPIILCVRKLYVYEYQNLLGEYAQAVAEISFCRYKDGKIAEILDKTSVRTQGNTNDVTSMHTQNLRYALDDCLLAFLHHDWREEDLAYRDLQAFQSENDDMVKEPIPLSSAVQVRISPRIMYSSVLKGPAYSGLSNDIETIAIPDIKTDIAGGLSIITVISGNSSYIKGRKHSLLEFGFVSTGYFSKSNGVPYLVNYSGIDLNLEFCLKVRQKENGYAYSYLLVGLCSDSYEVCNGARSKNALEMANAYLFGSGFNLGLEIKNEFSKRICGIFSIVFRQTSLSSARGMLEEASNITDPIQLQYLNFSFGLAFN